jgi:hypothetical protein
MPWAIIVHMRVIVRNEDLAACFKQTLELPAHTAIIRSTPFKGMQLVYESRLGTSTPA